MNCQQVRLQQFYRPTIMSCQQIHFTAILQTNKVMATSITTMHRDLLPGRRRGKFTDQPGVAVAIYMMHSNRILQSNN